MALPDTGYYPLQVDPVTYIRQFLAQIEKAYPPARGHHSLTACRYGSDLSGWSDELCLTLRFPDSRVRNYFLDAGDLTPDPVQSASRVVLQLGVHGDLPVTGIPAGEVR